MFNLYRTTANTWQVAVVAIGCAASAFCLPQSADARLPDSTETPSETTLHPARWTALPILFSSPETGFAIGLLPQFVFRTAENTRTSSVKLGAYVTQNRQTHIRLSSMLWLPENQYAFEGKLQFEYWPSSFYGTTNDRSETVKERYIETTGLVTLEAQRLVRPGLYAGLRYDFQITEVNDYSPEGLLASGEERGSNGMRANGIGVLLSIDTRDEVIYPTRGVHVRFTTRQFLDTVGDNNRFARHRFDARAYRKIAPKQVIAGQAVIATASGRPPFQMMTGVGDVVRGYSSGRYLDNQMIAAQAEYRVDRVWKRFGVVVFVGAGQVAQKVSDFSPGRFHFGGGAGLRFQLLSSEKVHLRWDFGFGHKSSATYLDIGEAF